jgi:hypothetical protein
MIRDLKNILEQINQPAESSLVPINLNHPLYWIWKAENIRIRDLFKPLRTFRPEHARVDIFINGQYISDVDYLVKRNGTGIIIKFKKINFQYQLDESDYITIEGDIERKNEN